jgi:hypothetical protein
MPLITSGGEPQSPWVEGVNFKHLEKVGEYIKYDLLGLETMRLIERTIELILLKQGTNEGRYEIALDDGRTIFLGGDDLVLTSNRGEIRARELQDGDDVISYKLSAVHFQTEES